MRQDTPFICRVVCWSGKVIPQNGMQRLIGYLLQDVEMDAACGPNTLTVSLPASKATIASRLSLTPEYFSRVLHELEAQQLITIDRQGFPFDVLMDIQALREFMLGDVNQFVADDSTKWVS